MHVLRSGSTRIMGEMKKLRIKVGRGTVVNVLKGTGVPTVPHRGESTWDDFARAHGETLWARDLLRRPVLTARSVVEAFVLVFIHIVTRRAYATVSTIKPTEEWTARESQRFLEVVRETNAAPACNAIIRSRDCSFGKRFDGVPRNQGVTPVRLPHCSQNSMSKSSGCRASRSRVSTASSCLELGNWTIWSPSTSNTTTRSSRLRDRTSHAGGACAADDALGFHAERGESGSFNRTVQASTISSRPQRRSRTR